MEAKLEKKKRVRDKFLTRGRVTVGDERLARACDHLSYSFIYSLGFMRDTRKLKSYNRCVSNTARQLGAAIRRKKGDLL